MPWQLSVVMIQCNAGEDGDHGEIIMMLALMMLGDTTDNDY